MSRIHIVIPTYNRPKEIERLCAHISASFPKDQTFTFTLVDNSSSKEAREQNLGSCQSAGINYEFSLQPVVSVRCFDVVKFITSPYAALLGDDDIPYADGYLEAADFLDSNPEYVLAHGRYSCFGDFPKPWTQAVNYDGPDLAEEDRIERLFRYLAAYTCPNLYGLHRTTVLQQSLQMVVDTGIDRGEDTREDGVHFELLASTVPVMLGKVKRTQKHYQARHIDFRKDLNYQKWATSPHFSTKYQKLRGAILSMMTPDELARNGHLAMDYGFAVFLAASIPPQNTVSLFKREYRKVNYPVAL